MRRSPPQTALSYAPITEDPENRQVGFHNVIVLTISTEN